ncbi:MAG: hypothetical protein M9952_02770 [Microthrixaceae bacterium]|nr:hypothetical protein [Microthrixaceae bacterium]
MVVVDAITDEESEVLPGGAEIFDELRELSTERGAFVLVIEAPLPTERYARSILSSMASHAPRLRGDVPGEPFAPAVTYGDDRPTDVLRLIVDQVGQLMDAGLGDHVVASWRSRAQPTLGPAPWLRLLPDDYAAWEGWRITGRIPAGFSELGPEDAGHLQLAAAGHRFRVEAHAVPVLVALLEGEPLPLGLFASNCPNGDPWCAHRAVEQLGMLGLVDARIPTVGADGLQS